MIVRNLLNMSDLEFIRAIKRQLRKSKKENNLPMTNYWTQHLKGFFKTRRDDRRAKKKSQPAAVQLNIMTTGIFGTQSPPPAFLADISPEVQRVLANELQRQINAHRAPVEMVLLGGDYPFPRPRLMPSIFNESLNLTTEKFKQMCHAAFGELKQSQPPPVEPCKPQPGFRGFQPSVIVCRPCLQGGKNPRCPKCGGKGFSIPKTRKSKKRR